MNQDTVDIDLEIKFTSVDMNRLEESKWRHTFNCKLINFDMRKLEWISISEITFIYGWIFQLIQKKKKVKIRLQDATTISTLSNTFSRRQRCYTNLVYKCSLLNVFNDEKGNNLVEFENNGMKIKEDFIPLYNENFIPFFRIKASNYEIETSSKEFEIIQANINEKISLLETLKDSLKNEGLNQIDNNSLSYIITKELYTNSCHHGYGDKSDKIKECYISIGYEKKIADEKINDWVWNRRMNEKGFEERKFYERNRNKSFLVYTFLDFGITIPESLRKNYYTDSNYNQKKEKYARLLRSDHFEILKEIKESVNTKNIDSLILEYSFLLSTSRNEFGENLLFHDFLPRGLYVIKDIIRRNKGLLMVKSGNGKIIYDFSESNISLDEIVTYGENTTFFPGTMISIIFPSRENETIELKDTRLLVESSRHNAKITVICLLDLYTKAQNDFSEKNDITAFIFKEISGHLKDFNETIENTLVIFDYAGIDIKYHEFSRNLLYYLSLSSFINNKVQAIVFNITDYKTLKGFADLNHSIYEVEEKSKEKVFKGIYKTEIEYLSKPIPCILPDLKIFWIGMKNLNNQKILNKIWTKKEDVIEIAHLQNDIFENHFLSIQIKERKPYLKFEVTHFFDVINSLIEYQNTIINNEISNNGISFKQLIYTDDEGKSHNYNKVLHSDENENWFLASNGFYQERFLSFIEKIYLKEYRRFLATHLILKYEKLFSYDHIKRRPNKILTVTLSSELLGKEVKDIYTELSDDFEYTPLYLIPLSNYYEFEKEEPFKDIHDGDSVLVVNDVISTGGLSNKIKNSLTSVSKSIEVCAFLTIVDCRIKKDRYVSINDDIVSLIESPTELFLEPPDKKKVIWISPIINAPITLKKKTGKTLNILFKLEDFFSLIDVETVLYIGHMRHNTTHHTYYIFASKLYRVDKSNGYRFLKKIFKSINEEKSDYDRSNLGKQIDELKKESNLLMKKFDILKSNISNAKYQKGIPNKAIIKIEKNIDIIKSTNTTIEDLLKSIQVNIQQQEIEYSKPDLSIDFIFIPFLSSAMEIIDDIPSICKESNGEKNVEVFPIPRINTPKGWRFTFPPKFLNSISKQKSNSRVLILDDGSWSGETLVQMIDCVCFLPVSEIIVLSIIARLDDYQREFLSRIKKIKSKRGEIPIKIFFGININIPVYPAGSNLFPFIQEEKELDNIYLKTISQTIKEYILHRKIEIKSEDTTSNDEINIPTKIPKSLNKQKIFILRNFIGKYESYRLYKDDVDDMIEKAELLFEDYNSMIAVILHEPYLLTVINRIDISNNAIENLKNYLKQIFNGITETLWDKTSLLKIYSFLDRYEFCTVDFLNLVLNYVQDEKIPINYLTYFLYKNFIDRESIHQDRIDRAFRTLIYISVRELFKASPIRSYQYQSFRQLFNILEITPDPEEIIFSLASIKVCEIFKNEETENGHECLDSHIENLINEVDKSDKRNADLHEWSDNIHPKITEILKYMMAFKDFLATFKPGIFKKIFTERDEDSLIKVRNELDEYFSDNQKFLESNSIYLIRKLEFIKVDIMSVESDVFRFFFDFMCNFKAIWVEQLNEFIEKRNTNNVSFVCDLLMGEEIAIPFFIVGIHKSMLKNVYSLFFDNIKKHVLKNKIIKYYFLCENNYIRLCVEQNQAFDRNTPGGYGIKRISDILSFYEGKFEVITDENNAEFTRFEISLPILNNKYGKISSYHN